jgi:hypothetical protein
MFSTLRHVGRCNKISKIAYHCHYSTKQKLELSNITKYLALGVTAGVGFTTGCWLYNNFKIPNKKDILQVHLQTEYRYINYQLISIGFSGKSCL